MAKDNRNKPDKSDKDVKPPKRGDAEGFKRPDVSKRDLERGYSKPD